MKNNIALIIVAASVLVAVGLIFYPKIQAGRGASLDGFAQCLADSGATMYGAYWCSHCKTEKDAFGASWKLVPYVECTKDTALCLQKDIKGYPTWIFDDGRRYEGVQGLERLSEASGCPLP